MIRKRSIVEKLLMGMLGLGILAAWAAANVQTLGIGQPAPDFNLHGVIVDQNGPKVRPFALQDFALSDVMVVAFMANHCPVATAYEDRLIQLAKDYQNRGVAVVAISPNEPRPLKANEPVGDRGDTLGEMAVRAVKKGFPFPYLYDGDAQEVSRAFGPVATPHIFIFDKQRKLRYSGRIDDSQDPAKVATREARDAIEALLAGKTVPVATTKAFGCSIKWRQGKENAAARDAANVAGSTPEAILTAANANPGAVTPIDAAGISALVANRDGAAPRLISRATRWGRSRSTA